MNIVRPRNFVWRTSVNAASVPRITEPVAFIVAIRRLSNAASMICRSSSSAAYQRVEKPCHTVTRGLALNEYTTSATIGRYRNANANETTV